MTRPIKIRITDPGGKECALCGSIIPMNEWAVAEKIGEFICCGCYEGKGWLMSRFDGEPDGTECGAPWNWDDENECCACDSCRSAARRRAREEREIDDYEDRGGEP